MSFLPYGGGRGGWFGAFTVSGLVHGALLAGLMGVYGRFLVPPPPERDPTAFLVTLERLDSDTLAGTAEVPGEAGGENEDPADPPPSEAEDLETLEAETPIGTEAEAAEAETIVPETVTPETAEPAPVEPETVAAEAMTAVPIAPDDPDLSPIVPETVAAAQTVAPAATGDQTLTPDAPAMQTVTALNTAPQAPPTAPVGAAARPAASRPPPSAQDLAIGDLIGRIRAATADPCLIALPRRDGADGVGLALVSAQDGAMELFAQEALTAEDAALRQTRTLVDPRQCPALNYIRQNRDYPATAMGLRIDTPEVQSGGRLTGVLRGAAGRYVTLLLIDDNGVVQDLQRFLAFSGNLARFDVPVTRAGPSRDTSQLLLAIATRRPPDAIRARIGRLAQDVFTGLEGELASGAALAVATFDVR